MRISKSVIAIPPGATIREQLELRGMKQKEFAQRMDMSEKHISRLISGHVELTQDVAIRLEDVLGVPANFWNNLEILYREALARVEEENDMESEVEFASKFPYLQASKLGWVPAATNSLEKVHNLRKFFEVAKLSCLGDLGMPGIAYRRLGSNDTSDYALALWAQKVRLQARDINVGPIDVKGIKNLIPTIREMTLKTPDEFCERIISLFAEVGVAVVFLQHLKGSYLHGATFYDGNKIVMGLTARGTDADRFWFSLFHEMGHILAGHLNKKALSSEEAETEADEIAKNILIPAKAYFSFVEKGDYTKDAILEFAANQGVAPGIVVGRLQKEKRISYDKYSDLKEHYKIAC